MQIRPVNPWSWQEKFAYSQGAEVTGATRTLYCAGQASVDGEGNPVHPGDMAAQLAQAFDNLEQVLAKAGMGLGNLVRLNIYTTDIAAFFAASGVVEKRLAGVSCKPPGTLLGVAALFHPAALIEIEATAVA